MSSDFKPANYKIDLIKSDVFATFAKLQTINKPSIEIMEMYSSITESQITLLKSL
jgi:hypothetical protein